MDGTSGRTGKGRALSDWEADELRALRRRGESLRALAARYGVSERTVSRYLRRCDGERDGG